jgi:glycosyltransferase involved in cell wall biosynthesis
VRFRFLTSTPLDIRRGSGTYVGMRVLAGALGDLGHTVEFETPRLHWPVYTFERLAFNWGLRPSSAFDVTVGFDLDGYRIAGEGGHVAALKGVIADELRFERGATRLTMAIQARCERLHARRAARVLVTSQYSAERARELYGLARTPTVVAEPIDLAEWRRGLADHPARAARFTVLYVGRHYRRKRVDVLLRAAAELRGRIPGIEIRIAGDGPCRVGWQRLAGELRLEGTVSWLGDVSRGELAAEYNRADVFCLPSVQEGFGIVLLEAMAAAKPIVAARAAAIPEVAPHAALVDPDSPAALAGGIEALWRSEERRDSMRRAGAAWVEQFDAARVARRFVEAVTPALSPESGDAWRCSASRTPRRPTPGPRGRSPRTPFCGLRSPEPGAGCAWSR